jgi:hypothetical protein
MFGPKIFIVPFHLLSLGLRERIVLFLLSNPRPLSPLQIIQTSSIHDQAWFCVALQARNT